MDKHLHVTGWGVFLGKKSQRLTIKEKGELKEEVPIIDIDEVTIDSRGVSLSVDAIRELVKHGVHINFMSYNGTPWAKITAPGLSATVETRRQQLLAYTDERGLQLSRMLVQGKLGNQAATLKYFAKSRKGTETYGQIRAASERIRALQPKVTDLPGRSIDEVRAQLMNIEGRAAKTYWDKVSTILDDKVRFPGRRHRNAADPVNSALNYGYGILYSRVMGAILLAGLDPYAGFLHVDRPGKPSLVLDAVEEFRQMLVDRPVIAKFRQGMNLTIGSNGQMNEKSRKAVAAAVLSRFDARDKYEGKRHTFATIMQRQIRHIASFLRGEYSYRPHIAGW